MGTKRRALVLGGGGPVGIAWETGLLAGLERRGLHPGAADLIVGTSAGSVVGAQLALGKPAEEMYAREVSRPPRPSSRKASDGERTSPPDTRPLMALLAKRPPHGETPQDLRAEVGAFARSAHTRSEEAFLSGFARLPGLADSEFPERLVCTAVDALDGSFAVWDRDAGVDLLRAVTSSCAVPGVYPPVTIHGRPFMDGGVRSRLNVDLAKGYDIVLVLVVAAGRFAEAIRRRADPETAFLEAEGAEVAVIFPDEGSREAAGPNLMDASRRQAVARAGFDQGRVEAARLRPLWS